MARGTFQCLCQDVGGSGGIVSGSGQVWMAVGRCRCGDGVSKAELMLPGAPDSTEAEQGPRCHARSALSWEGVTTRDICAAYSFWDMLILL